MDPVQRPIRTRPRPGEVDSADAVADAVRRAVRLLERYRRQSVLDSASHHGGRRYEELCLAAAIARLERHLRVAEEVTDWEGIRSWVEDVLADRSAERDLGPNEVVWLSSRGRRKANARARRRFEAITADVFAQLEDPEVSAEPKPNGRPARCAALTQRGTRCKNPAVVGRLCGLHARLPANRLLPAPPRPGRDSKRLFVVPR